MGTPQVQFLPPLPNTFIGQSMLRCTGYLLPWFSGKETACQCRRRGFNPWVQKIPLEKEMATPTFLPGKSLGQRSLVGYGPQGWKESDITQWLNNKTNNNRVSRPSGFRVSSLDQWLSKCGLQSIRISIIWELVKNANSRASLQT